jgi:NAD(P)-dependent dehydrogenase (short-subunit alcohol dehydrogenase family)
MDLEKCSAVVAGGAGGLGMATVRRLAAIGVRVVVFDTDAKGAARVAEDVGSGVVSVAGDSNDDEDVAEAILAAQRLGLFSIVVSATGVAIPAARLVTRDAVPHPMASFLANLELHTRGTFNIVRFAAAAFSGNQPDEDGQRGVIVNTASIAAFDAQTGQVAYGAAKAAVVGMTLPMARDLAPIGVRVVTIAPGSMDTPRLRTPAIREALIRDVAFPKRLGDPDEYAQLVEAIVRIRYLNGEVIRLDGGMRQLHGFA